MTPHSLLHRVLDLTVTATLFFGSLAFVTDPLEAQTGELGTLIIPSISIQAQIVSVPMAYPTWDVSGLGSAVGSLEGTGGWPGQPGNFVLAGHATVAADTPGIFADLTSVKVGDEIDVYVQDTVRRYEVTWTGLVDEMDISVVLPTLEEKLTLITCDPLSYDSRAATYLRRFVVVAVPVA